MISQNLPDQYKYLLDQKPAVEEIFSFKTNGGEVDIQYDNSWKKEKNELYTEEEIKRMGPDTSVADSMQVESLSNYEHIYR